MRMNSCVAESKHQSFPPRLVVCRSEIFVIEHYLLSNFCPNCDVCCVDVSKISTFREAETNVVDGIVLSQFSFEHCAKAAILVAMTSIECSKNVFFLTQISTLDRDML